VTEQPGWQLEREAAELYERLLVGPVTSVWARDLVERVGLRPGARVLDLACGTGVVTRLATTTSTALGLRPGRVPESHGHAHAVAR
jgi:2-polyprenyl-3-methyl-5-hydroxy-6-metoxy-1,4-benzoquinol methylase